MSADLASVTFYDEDSASPMTMTRPAATVTNDLLIAILGDQDGVLADITTPSGWTQQATVDITGMRCKVFSHVAAGGDPGTWDFPYNSGSATAGCMILVTGADTTPTIVSASGSSASNGASLDSPTVTPTSTDDLLICALTNSGGAALFSYVAPSGMTDKGSRQVSNLYQAIAIAKQQLVSGSATGAKTWTSISPTARQAGSFTLAIKSAAGGGAAGPDANQAGPYQGSAPGYQSPTGVLSPQTWPDLPSTLVLGDGATGTGTAYDATVSTSAQVNAPAGNATGAGVANSPVATVAPSAGNAVSTSTANTPAITIASSAGAGSATGTANSPVAAVAPSAGSGASTSAANAPALALLVSAVAGSSTGVASAPAASLSPSAGSGAGIGMANSTGITIAGGIGVATGTGTGTAGAPIAGLSPSAGSSAGTGVANGTGITIAGGIGVAGGTGAANGSTATLAPSAGSAASIGTVNTSALALGVNAGSAAGAGTAYNATVNTSSQTNVPAGSAAGTGTAYDASVTISFSAGSAPGVGTAHAPAPGVLVGVGVGLGSSAANAAATLVSASGGVASGGVAAWQPASFIATVTAGCGVGSGLAYDIVVASAIFPAMSTAVVSQPNRAAASVTTRLSSAPAVSQPNRATPTVGG